MDLVPGIGPSGLLNPSAAKVEILLCAFVGGALKKARRRTRERRGSGDDIGLDGKKSGKRDAGVDPEKKRYVDFEQVFNCIL